MQDYEPKNAMELADRIWGAISYERSVNHGRNDELELHLNTQSWIELLKLYEEGHVTIVSMNPMEKPFFAGIPIRMAAGMKDAWRLVRIVARG